MLFERAYLLGVNFIRTVFPSDADREARIAALRIHHAAGNAQLRLDAIGTALFEYLREPDPIRSSRLKFAASDGAARLDVLAGELRKSVPQIADRTLEREQPGEDAVDETPF